MLFPGSARSSCGIRASQQSVHAEGAGGRQAGRWGVTLSRGALPRAVLERELVLFQQILHRTLVLSFAFTDGLLLKRGEGAMGRSCSECSLCSVSLS